MKLPLRRFAASPSLAFGGKGTAPAARQSRFRGASGRRPTTASININKETDHVCRMWMQ